MLFLDPILYFFGASAETIPYARDYMVVITLGNVVTHVYFGLNALLRATGNPRKSMMATIYSVIINIILTPLFIYVFNWGIRGAALATVIAQTVMLLWQIRFFSNKNNYIRLQKGIFKLKRQIVTDSLSIGMAPFLMNAASSIIIIIINRSLITHGGDLAVGAYGIINRVAALFAMVVMGLNQGMQPIAGYNFGAKQYDRVTSVLKRTIFLATGVMTAGFLIAELFPFCRLFPVYPRQRTDHHCGSRIADRHDFCPDSRVPNGILQFFPEHRDGKKSHLSLSHPANYLPAALFAYPPAPFRRKRRLVQHAGG